MNIIVIDKIDIYIDYYKIDIKEQIEEIILNQDICHTIKIDNTDNNDNNENLLKFIYNILDNPTIGVSMYNIYESKNYLYVGYYIDYYHYKDHSKIEDSELKIELNEFASQITSHQVISKFIIIKNEIKYNTTKEGKIKITTYPINLSLFELKGIIEKIYIKTGITVDDDKINIFEYVSNPIEHIMLTEKDYEKNYIYYEYEIFIYMIKIFIDKRNEKSKINKKASLLCNEDIKGRAYFALYAKPTYNECPPYIYLNEWRFNKILDICNKSRSLFKMDIVQNEYYNFDKILELNSKNI